MVTKTPMRQLIALNVHLKVKQLALIAALAETGSLRQAAEQIHVSQPAGTRLLHEIEEQLGVQLFERTRRGMRATFAGDVMIRHARFLLSNMMNAVLETVQTAAGNAGTVRLGVIGAIDPALLASALTELHANNPALRVIIKEAPQEMLLDALKRAELDIVIGRMNAPDPNEALNFEVMYLQEFSLLASVSNPLCEITPLSLKNLQDATWILPPQDTLLRQRIETLFLIEVGGIPRSFIESASLMSNMAIIRQSNIIGFMPKQIAQWFEQNRQVRILPIELEGLNRPVAMVTLGSQAQSPAVEQLLALIRICARRVNGA
jgi:DNA-binding transcriptional LysR family regulator